MGTYADIFVELARLKVIPEEFAQAIKGMVGLRNLLVHEYAGIDMAVLSEVLHNRLDDFRSFALYVTKYIA